MRSRYRSSHKTHISLLQAAGREGNTKSKIQYIMELCWTQVSRYLGKLTNEFHHLEFKNGRYYMTDKGERFIGFSEQIGRMVRNLAHNYPLCSISPPHSTGSGVGEGSKVEQVKIELLEKYSNNH
jgi:predicted transcriptional regulator